MADQIQEWGERDWDEEGRLLGKAFQRWLQEKWIGGPCWVCKITDWTIDGMGQIHTYGQGAPGGGGCHYPIGVVSCRNCGNMVLMSFTGNQIDEWLEEERAKQSEEAAEGDTE